MDLILHFSYLYDQSKCLNIYKSPSPIHTHSYIDDAASEAVLGFRILYRDSRICRGLNLWPSDLWTTVRLHSRSKGLLRGVFLGTFRFFLWMCSATHSPASSWFCLLSSFQMQFMLLFSRQGKLRLQKWYVPLSDKEKKKITRELVQTVLARKPKMCSFLEWRDLKIVYKR